jgi:hypothetical protein
MTVNATSGVGTSEPAEPRQLRLTLETSNRCSGSEIGGDRARYPVTVVDHRYRRPAIERAARMADSERPHLTQTDLEFLRYLKKGVLIIELHDPHIRRVA